jgi:hypothetical protein
MISPETIPAGTRGCGTAAKLVLLQRVGGAVSDDLLSQLQPVLLAYEILRAGLAKPEPDLQALQAHAEQIKPAVQRAMRAGTAAAEWLQPAAGASTPSTELVAECIALLRPEFELCGLPIALAVEGEAIPLQRAQGRTMICAVLAHAGEQAEGPAQIHVELRHRAGRCELRVARRAPNGALPADFLKPQHAPIGWDNLQALAELEQAVVRRAGDDAIVLELAARGHGA